MHLFLVTCGIRSDLLREMLSILSLRNRRRVAITARHPKTHAVHTVLLEADLDEATSFGPLAPMWKALQDDGLGGWKVTAGR